MKTTASLCILGVAAFANSAVGAPDLSKLPAPSAQKGVTYEKDIRPMLEESCFRCHGAERQRGDLRLDSLAAVIAGGEDGKVVVPGQSAKSPLVIAVAQLDDETAMPPKRGRGGPGGFGPGIMLSGQMIQQGDKNDDHALSKGELAALADNWFDKLDPDKTGKVTQEQFVEHFGAILPPRQGFGRGGGRPGGEGPGAPGRGGAGQGQDPRGNRPGPQGGPGGPGGRGGPSGPGGFGPARFLAPGFFTAVDADHDGTLTRDELKATFAKWFNEWDAQKGGSLSQQQLQKGLDSVLPRPNFRGPGGPGGPGGFGIPGGPRGDRGPGGPPGGPQGQRGPGGFGGPGGGPPAKPLTSEQVSLIRAWIDQGAK